MLRSSAGYDLNRRATCRMATKMPRAKYFVVPHRQLRDERASRRGYRHVASVYLISYLFGIGGDKRGVINQLPMLYASP